MNWRNIFNRTPTVINEEIQSFKGKGADNISDRHMELRSGEGIDDLSLLQNIQGYGKESLGTFNMFYSKFINVSFENERQRIFHYRGMAESPEIGDVIEDAVIESTNEDMNGDIMVLEIKDNELLKSDNTIKILNDEFNDLFYNRLNIKNKLFDLFRTYMVDGRVYYERLIHEGKARNGIIGIKRLPTETMDFLYDPLTGKTLAYFQYLSDKVKRYNNVEEAKQDSSVIVFLPEQIGFVDFGVYGVSKTEIVGFLEKAKQPFNQLKLLETSVIIYRLIRSPERLVFRIDTGNMPKDKAMKFVEEVKRKFTKKVSYDSNTGQMTNNPEVFSLLENYFLPQSSDGKGSQIDSVGGNSAGFTQLDDIYYFQRKLYKALKYPMTRVKASQEGRDSEVVFGGSQVGQIQRDEIQWSKMLERHQNKFCDEFCDLFMLHLELKGLKKEYEIDKSKFTINMTPPNNYKYQMQQQLLASRMDNYSHMSSDTAFSKSFLMREYLGFDDDMLEKNRQGFENDKKLFPKPEEDASGSGY